jgi:nucleotide-binding universal stress UspA family protein
VLLLQVLDPIPDYEVAGTTTLGYREIRRERMDAANLYLGDFCNDMRGTCAHTTALARIGEVADTILGVAAEQNADFIVMSTRGRGRFGRLLLGSVADRIARSSTVPVLLVHPRSTQEFVPVDGTAIVNRIVVPMDGSQRARNALPIAASVARQLSVPVHLIRAVPLQEKMMADQRYYESFCTAASDGLESEASKLRATGLEATTKLLIGETVPLLLDELGSGDLVIMTSHGEGGIRRWQLGSVAEKLINLAPAPILLVPDPARVRLQ